MVNLKINSEERGTSTAVIILAIVIAAVGSATGTYLVTSQEEEGISKAKFNNQVSSLESSISDLETNINDLNSTVSELTEEKEWHTVLNMYREDTKTGRTESFTINSDRWRVIYHTSAESVNSELVFWVMNANTDKTAIPIALGDFVYRPVPALGLINIDQEGTFYIDVTSAVALKEYRIVVQAYY